MKRELILLRHGKSDWSQPVSDYKRPIKKRGFKEAGRVGVWLLTQDLVPAQILCSPARRARETAWARPRGCIAYYQTRSPISEKKSEIRKEVWHQKRTQKSENKSDIRREIRQ